MSMPTASVRHRMATGLVAGLMLLLMGFAMMGPSSASASETQFCQGAPLGAIGSGFNRCHDPSFRWVTRTWVRSWNGASGCASALNGGGSLVGGLICASSRTFIDNGNYNGSQLLQALISDNTFGLEIYDGKVNFN